MISRRALLKAALGASALSCLPVNASRASDLKLKGYLRTNWSEDPFSYGSYSYFAKGSSRKDARRLAKPIDGRLFFAGEATHPDYNSTVHAAYESGLIAAEQLGETGAVRVAVIGAGISGLAAAKALQSPEMEVTVFEARERIGGRIWTDTRLAAPLDLGASWIHGIEENPLTTLSNQLDLARDTTADSFIMRGGDGRRMAEREAPDWLDDIVSVQHGLGADAATINDWAYWNNDGYEGPDQTFKQGYAAILEALKGDYSLQLQTLINRIVLTDQGVMIGTTEGHERRFDAVIVTVPLGVLKQGVIDFQPALPKAKREAIDRLGMGVLDKLYLQFERPFWDEAVTWIITPENSLAPGDFNQWFNLLPYIGEPILLAFNAGSNARRLATLSDETLLEKALQTLQLAYPLADRKQGSS